MRPNYRTFRVNDHYLVGACLEFSVTVLQPDASTIAYHVDFEANCDDHFFLSHNGRLMAAAFSSESFCCIEVVNLRDNPIILPELRENATCLRLERAHALDVLIAPDEETLFYYAHGKRSGTYAFHIPTGQCQKLSKAAFPMKGAWLAEEAILPVEWGKGGLHIAYWPFAVNSVELPSKSNVWHLIEHPSMESILMLDAKGRVASLCADTLEVQWCRSIPVGGWISYTGDGKHIGIQEYADSKTNTEPKSTLVLNSKSGETVRRVDDPDRAAWPLDGSRFLCLSGRFLNAETGEFEEGVSAPGFWDALRRRNGLCS